MISRTFHSKSDINGPTLILFRNDKNCIFGGYSPITWSGNNVYQKIEGCFIFTLKNNYGIPPTKFNNYQDNISIGQWPDYGPIFGNVADIYVHINNFGCVGGCSSTFPHNYIDTTGKGKSLFTGNYDNDNINMNLTEIETFKVIKYN